MNLTMKVLVGMVLGIVVGLVINLTGLNAAGSFINEFVVECAKQSLVLLAGCKSRSGE